MLEVGNFLSWSAVLQQSLTSGMKWLIVIGSFCMRAELACLAVKHLQIVIEI